MSRPGSNHARNCGVRAAEFGRILLCDADDRVDERWLVPHFEKMLYDQALLSLAYTEAFQVTGQDFYSQVVREILTYVQRDMTSPEGGFYSAEDADSEGEEGLFYVWKQQEILEQLGEEEGGLFCRFFNITGAGNFEHGLSIPHVSGPACLFAEREGISESELNHSLHRSREQLFRIREERIHPLKDDKILSAWNGMMITAFSRAYQALGDSAYLEAARRCADFVLSGMRRKNGLLYRSFRQGEASIPGFQEDYAFLVWGLIELYESSFEVRYLKEALELNKTIIEIFGDKSGGGFFFSGKDNEQLIARVKDSYDGATPSGNSVAVMNLLRLGRMTGDTGLEKKAEKAMRAFSSQISSYPMGSTHFLMAADFFIGPSQEIVISGDPANATTREMIEAVHRSFLPNKVLLLRGREDETAHLEKIVPFVKNMGSGSGQVRVFWCENYTCKEPITSVDKLREAIASTAKG